MVVGSRSERARQRMNRQTKQLSSTESSSLDEGKGGEGGGKSLIAMDTSPSEGNIHIIDVILMEESTETIGRYIYMCIERE